MAPSLRADEPRLDTRRDRKTRKPLVEKRRRARINESLRELRLLLADGEARLENAEVLELTVRRVQAVLERRPRGHGRRRRRPGAPAEGGRLQREASERFAAGYIQCMHEVHTFVSACPAIDAATAAELLNHLLESMPLNEGAFQDLLADAWAEPALLAPPAEAAPAPSPPSSGDENGSDAEETDAEPGQTAAAGLDTPRARGLPSSSISKSMWRPW